MTFAVLPFDSLVYTMRSEAASESLENQVLLVQFISEPTQAGVQKCPVSIGRSGGRFEHYLSFAWSLNLFLHLISLLTIFRALLEPSEVHERARIGRITSVRASCS